MSFFDPAVWTDAYYSAGWRPGTPTRVNEPATGNTIGSYGSVDASVLDEVVQH
jgi:hypothetical protein